MQITQIKNLFRFENLALFFSTLFLFFLAYSEAIKSISLAAILILFIYGIATKKLFLTKDALTISLSLFVFFSLIGIITGISFDESSQQISDLFKFLLVFLFYRELKINNLEISSFINILFFGFIFAFIAGAIDFLRLDFLTLDLLADSNKNQVYIKLRSLGSHNRTAIYYVLITMIALSYFVYSYRKNNRVLIMKSNLLILFVLIASLIGIFLGGSRMAMYSLPVLIFIFLLLEYGFKLKHLSFLIVIFASIFLIFVVFFPETYYAEKLLMGFRDPARLWVWEYSLRSYFHIGNYFFGIGTGNSILLDVNEYSTILPNPGIKYINNAHNLYLDTLLEKGIAGLVSLFYFFYKLISNSFKKISIGYIHKINILTISSILLMGFFNITFRYEFALLLAVIAGLSLNKNFIKH